MNEQAVAIPTPAQLATMDNPPENVLREAQKAAAALKDVISAKPNKVVLNNEQYLEFEDWQTLARFYGTTAKEDGDPEFVEIGGVKGFRASAVALCKGQVISRATAYCMRDEEKWGSRTKYEYAYVLKGGGHSVEDPGRDQIIWEDNPKSPGKKRPRKARVKVGEETVPLYQLASMAQTRANAKVLRNVLSWVAVLAGYKPTPAEELPGASSIPQDGNVIDAEVESPAGFPESQAATGDVAGSAPAGGPLSDTDALYVKISELMEGAGWTKAKLTSYINKTYQGSMGDLTKLDKTQLAALVAYLHTEQRSRPA